MIPLGLQSEPAETSTNHVAHEFPRGFQVLAVLYEAKDKVTPELLSCKENELNLRKWLEGQGHTYVVVSDKDGEDSEFDKELKDADVVISTPFHPAYLTRCAVVSWR